MAERREAQKRELATCTRTTRRKVKKRKEHQRNVADFFPYSVEKGGEGLGVNHRQRGQGVAHFRTETLLNDRQSCIEGSGKRGRNNIRGGGLRTVRTVSRGTPLTVMELPERGKECSITENKWRYGAGSNRQRRGLAILCRGKNAARGDRKNRAIGALGRECGDTE